VLAAVLVAAAWGGPSAGHAAAVPHAHAANDDDGSKDAAKKDKDKKDKDKGGSPAPEASTATPAAPAPASTSAPATATVPGAVSAPGASAAPTLALDTPTLIPTLGVSVGVAPASGTVVVRTADGRSLNPLAAATTIPDGAHVDARHGTVELSSALDAAGAHQTATFSGGIFAVSQPHGGNGLTRIALVGGDFSRCAAGAPAAVPAAQATAAARRRKPVRQLWGHDDHGRYQTRGGASVATVRGTRWLTQDFCDGTRTTVYAGAVAVRDDATGQVHVVRAGHSHFARNAVR